MPVHAYPTLLVVALYLFVTMPFIALVPLAHALRSDYTRLFMAGLVLQLIPIGLVFFPLGFIGVAILGITFVSAHRRNRRFRDLAIDNPDVYRRWSCEYILNAFAFGFAMEQKGVAWLFLEVVSKHGFHILGFLIAVSLCLWMGIGWLIAGEYRSYRKLVTVTH